MKTKALNWRSKNPIKHLAQYLRMEYHNLFCGACSAAEDCADVEELLQSVGGHQPPLELEFKLLADAASQAKQGQIITSATLRRLRPPVRKSRLAAVVLLATLLMATAAFAAYKVIHTPQEVDFQGIPALELEMPQTDLVPLVPLQQVTWQALEQALQKVHSFHLATRQDMVTDDQRRIELFYAEQWAAAPMMFRQREMYGPVGNYNFLDHIVDGVRAVSRQTAGPSLAEWGKVDFGWGPDRDTLAADSTLIAVGERAAMLLPSPHIRAKLKTEMEEAWLGGRRVYLMHYSGGSGVQFNAPMEGTLVVDAHSLLVIERTTVVKMPGNSQIKPNTQISTTAVEYNVAVPESYFWTGQRPDKKDAAAKWDENTCRQNVMVLTAAVIKYCNDHNGEFPDAENWVGSLKPYLQQDGVKLEELLHCPLSNSKGLSYVLSPKLQGARLISSPGEPAGTVEFADGSKNTGLSVVTVFEVDVPTGAAATGRQKGSYFGFASGNVIAAPSLESAESMLSN